mmetsp:Transcript_75787/g.173477  ORF Transcript_75787/g.173477 Transcript_75787/m.173477 type:complete len:270 (-) Transcript_75787:2-811(-)
MFWTSTLSVAHAHRAFATVALMSAGCRGDCCMELQSKATMSASMPPSCMILILYSSFTAHALTNRQTATTRAGAPTYLFKISTSTGMPPNLQTALLCLVRTAITASPVTHSSSKIVSSAKIFITSTMRWIDPALLMMVSVSGTVDTVASNSTAFLTTAGSCSQSVITAVMDDMTPLLIANWSMACSLPSSFARILQIPITVRASRLLPCVRSAPHSAPTSCWPVSTGGGAASFSAASKAARSLGSSTEDELAHCTATWAAASMAAKAKT